MSLVTNNISGSASNNSKIGITGSVIFANTPSNDFPAFPGNDVVFFVSGSIGDQYKAKSVFGGDLVVSGSLTLPANVIEVTGSIEATLGFSGSLTQLVDGTSYLIAGQNITITSQSNGSITISSQGGGGGGYEQTFVDGDLVAGVLSVNHGLSNDYVHVSVYDNNDYLIIPDEVIVTGVGTVDIVLTSFTPLVGNWNVLISIGGAAEPAPPINSIQYNDNNLFAGSANFTYYGQTVHITGSLQNGSYSKTIGSYSHAEGDSTIAIGNYSHAEGVGTKSIGDNSHAEGDNTTSWGNISHAEGYVTVASGTYSHAEGESTLTTEFSLASHAEGHFTIAEGEYSHAEGYSNKSYGNYSHAEGQSTVASGSYSHAEGGGCITNGEASHAEGFTTLANGEWSHAEGYTTIAEGNYSHAEGYLTVAEGNYSHASGFKSLAAGVGSHAQGYLTTSSAGGSHTEGYKTKTSVGSLYSHAEGYDTITLTEDYIHAEGYLTTGSGRAAHSEGYQTHAEGWYSHAEGRGTHAKGTYTHTEGYLSTASFGADYSHAGGYWTIADGKYQTVVGHFNTPISSEDTLFIVGNGTSNSLRSNAFTVAMNGVTSSVSTTFRQGSTAVDTSAGSETTYPILIKLYDNNFPLTSYYATWGIGINTSRDLYFSYGESTTIGNPTLDFKGYLDSATVENNLDFTGQHRSIPLGEYSQYSNRIGYIVISAGTYAPLSGNIITINDAIPHVELSSIRNDKRCFGVISDIEDSEIATREYPQGRFVSIYEKSSSNDNRLYINSLGEGAIWICNINGNLENGDYITTCEIPGYGMKQDDDLFHNYTVAKITCDCDFDLNSNLYKCEEFTHEGNTYRRAFVGCTYHCG